MAQAVRSNQAALSGAPGHEKRVLDFYGAQCNVGRDAVHGALNLLIAGLVSLSEGALLRFGFCALPSKYSAHVTSSPAGELSWRPR